MYWICIGMFKYDPQGNLDSMDTERMNGFSKQNILLQIALLVQTVVAVVNEKWI